MWIDKRRVKQTYQFWSVGRHDILSLQLGKVYGLEERLVAHVAGAATGDS